jgi:hypothetical protein
VDTHVGVPPAPRRTAGEAARDPETDPNLSIGDDTSRFAELPAEPREIGGVTEQVPSLQMDDDDDDDDLDDDDLDDDEFGDDDDGEDDDEEDENAEDPETWQVR